MWLFLCSGGSLDPFLSSASCHSPASAGGAVDVSPARQRRKHGPPKNTTSTGGASLKTCSAARCLIPDATRRQRMGGGSGFGNRFRDPLHYWLIYPALDRLTLVEWRAVALIVTALLGAIARLFGLDDFRRDRGWYCGLFRRNLDRIHVPKRRPRNPELFLFVSSRDDVAARPVFDSCLRGPVPFFAATCADVV